MARNPVSLTCPTWTLHNLNRYEILEICVCMERCLTRSSKNKKGKKGKRENKKDEPKLTLKNIPAATSD